MRLASTLALVLLSAPSAARAQQACGVDCAERTYVSCNDSLDLTSGAPQGIRCDASLGSCTGERFCATLGHGLPPSAFPLAIEKLTLVAADDNPSQAGNPFELQVYQELGTARPGAPIGPSYALNIAGSTTQATVIDLRSGSFQPIRIADPGPFRVCLTKGFDRLHNVCLDGDGAAAPGRNWTFVSVALDPENPCGSQLLPPAWYAADGAGSPIPGFPGLVGDFILRATVRPADFAAVPGAGGCGGGDDAGVGTDVRLIDTGARDTGPMEDAGSEEDAGAAPSPDAGAGSGPVIAAITPTRVEPGQAFALVVTGEGFADGLSATLGGVAIVDVALFGETTLRGSSPGLPSGQHDLLIANPDGRAAILTRAVLSGAPEDALVPADGCRCGGDRSPGAGLPGGIVLASIGIVLVRRVGSDRSRIRDA